LSNHLLHFYSAFIRPVLEYHSVVWHHGLTKALSETLEAVQHLALRIICRPAVGMPCMFALGLPVYRLFMTIVNKQTENSSVLYLPPVYPS